MQMAILAASAFEAELMEELRLTHARVQHQWGHLFLIDAPVGFSAAWAEDHWPHCEIIEYSSISNAAQLLRSRGKYWLPYSFHLHRRSALVQEQLPRFKVPEVTFGSEYKLPAFGYFCLLSENKILLCPQSHSGFPLGQWKFKEDKKAPSRAYLKLWELFTREGIGPLPGEVCVDLGSSPGGWTQVLARLGAHVISVDKAPLAPSVLKIPGVEYLKKDAFKLQPQDIPPVDWLFSDIICEPLRLYELIQTWQQSGRVKNFVCTIKFKGKTDFKALAAFKEISGSRILHLHHNKHELTFLLLRK